MTESLLCFAAHSSVSCFHLCLLHEAAVNEFMQISGTGKSWDGKSCGRAERVGAKVSGGSEEPVLWKVRSKH